MAIFLSATKLCYMYDSIINEVDCYKYFCSNKSVCTEIFYWCTPHVFSGVILWWKWPVPEDILPVLWSEWRTEDVCPGHVGGKQSTVISVS